MRFPLILTYVNACFLGLATLTATLPIDKNEQYRLPTSDDGDLEGQIADVSDSTLRELDTSNVESESEDQNEYAHTDTNVAIASAGDNTEYEPEVWRDAASDDSSDPGVLGPDGLFYNTSIGEEAFPAPPAAPVEEVLNSWEREPEWPEFLETAQSARSHRRAYLEHQARLNHIVEVLADIDCAMQPSSLETSLNISPDPAPPQHDVLPEHMRGTLRDLAYETLHAGSQSRLGLDPGHGPPALNVNSFVDGHTDVPQSEPFSPGDTRHSVPLSPRAPSPASQDDGSQLRSLNDSESSTLDSSRVPSSQAHSGPARKRRLLEAHAELLAANNNLGRPEQDHLPFPPVQQSEGDDGEERKTKKQRHDDKSVSCPDCPRCFKTASGLRAHREAGDCLKFLCGFEGCPYRSDDSRTVARHRLTHGEVAPQHHCEPCDKHYQRKDHLDRHMESPSHAKKVARMPPQSDIANGHDSLRVVGDNLCDGPVPCVIEDSNHVVDSISAQDQSAIRRVYDDDEEDVKARDKRSKGQFKHEYIADQDDMSSYTREGRQGVPPIRDFPLPDIQEDDLGYATSAGGPGRQSRRDDFDQSGRHTFAGPSRLDPWEGPSRNVPNEQPDGSTGRPSYGHSHGQFQASQPAAASNRGFGDWNNFDPRFRPAQYQRARTSRTVGEDEDMPDGDHEEEDDHGDDEYELMEDEPP